MEDDEQLLHGDIEPIATESWDDILNDNKPGRKRIIGMCLSLGFFLALAASYILYRTTKTTKEYASGTLLLIIETIILELISRIIQGPIKSPFKFTVKFFRFTVFFSIIGLTVIVLKE